MVREPIARWEKGGCWGAPPRSEVGDSAPPQGRARCIPTLPRAHRTGAYCMPMPLRHAMNLVGGSGLVSASAIMSLVLT